MTTFRRARPSALIAFGLCAALLAAPASAQQRAADKGKVYYDEYQPSRTPQLRSQGCMRDEESIRGFCVKSCKRGYLMVPDRNPPRCRSAQPLPPGQLPGPLRRETAKLANPPAPAEPGPRKPSGEY